MTMHTGFSISVALNGSKICLTLACASLFRIEVQRVGLATNSIFGL